MSILIGLRFNGDVILTTDSRVVDNAQKSIASDAQTKIFEVAPGVFYGWSGCGRFALPQARIARTISEVMRPQSLRAFADALDEASHPLMEELIKDLRERRDQSPIYEAQLAGREPFHAYVLATKGAAGPGFIAREFLLVNGQITHKETDSFQVPLEQVFLMYTTRGELVAPLALRTGAWIGGAIKGVERLVSRLRQMEPLVGGPCQMVCISKFGARWIHRPSSASVEALPAPDGVSLVGAVASGVTIAASQISAGILAVGVEYAGQINAGQVNAGTFEGLALTLNLNGVTTSIANQYNPSARTGYVGFKCTNNTAPNPYTAIGDGDFGVVAFDGNQTFAVLNPALVGIGLVGSSGNSITSGFTPTAGYVGGTQVLTGRQAGPGAPSGWADSKAQAWANTLYYALCAATGHGLIE
jgi:hypothetical protein